MSVHDGGEGLGQIAVRFDSVQLAGLAAGGQDGPVLCPGFVTCEETVLATARDGPDGAFDGVIFHLGVAIGEKQDQPLPVLCDVFERLASRGFG